MRPLLFRPVVTLPAAYALLAVVWRSGLPVLLLSDSYFIYQPLAVLLDEVIGLVQGSRGLRAEQLIALLVVQLTAPRFDGLSGGFVGADNGHFLVVNMLQ